MLHYGLHIFILQFAIRYTLYAIRNTQYFGEEGFYHVYNAYVGTFSNKVNKYIYRQVLNSDPYVSYEPHGLNALVENKWVIDVLRGNEETQKVQLSLYKIGCVYVVSALDVTFKKSVVWDYVIPFVIGLFTFIYCFYGSEATLVNAIKVVFV